MIDSKQELDVLKQRVSKQRKMVEENSRGRKERVVIYANEIVHYCHIV